MYIIACYKIIIMIPVSIFIVLLKHRHVWFQVRILRHSNINPLIGACLEPNRVCVVNGYCNKGSLRDVLQSRHMTVDKIFTAAFATDIVQVNVSSVICTCNIICHLSYVHV